MRTVEATVIAVVLLLSTLIAAPLVAQEPAPPEQQLQGVFPKKPPTLRTLIVIFRSESIGAIPTCTLHFPWMQALSAAASCHAMLICSPKAKK